MVEVHTSLLLKCEAGIVLHSGRDCQQLPPENWQWVPPDMAPACRMLELFKSAQKPEDEKVVKKEDVPSTPSPAKRMATEMEKKLKSMSGDVSLVKVGI